jgi:two-component system, NtrC family, response regulator HydG
LINIASSASPVLILGESGTGKELVAKAIHRTSPRKEKAFVVINCSALTETLLESELFGHTKGSFTGAIQDKKGLFQEADQGTVFLDEIGEISPSVQVKLLRVLQDGDMRSIGANQSVNVDVRIIAATNRDLYQLVKKGIFREDLFYRLNVIGVHLPPLRDRIDDIPLLAYHFLKSLSKRMNKKLEQISIDAMQSLQEYRWTGNVRELENVIERAAVLCQGPTITAKDLPTKILGQTFYVSDSPKDSNDFSRLSYQEAKEKALYQFNRNYIRGLLQQTAGNISLASIKAGMDRSNFKKIIRKCDITVDEFRKTS